MADQLVKDQRPLAGMVMCCTSITPEERHLIALSAEEMGAIHKFDLTSDVTHLVVGDVDTPKYKYVAKERPDVKVVLPSFVDAVRQVWINGGDVLLKEIEEAHEAPALMGLKVCLTGFESTNARDNIRNAVTQNGGDFHGDLTKAVTHLIAAAPEGKKYEHARRWNIKVVGIEWLQESIKRGMVLEESLYDPILAPQDRGKDAYNKQAMESVTLGKRPREEEQAPEPPARRKLRRTMSKKMASQQETIWADLAKAGSGQAPREDQWQAPEIDSVLGVLPPAEGSAEPLPHAVRKGPVAQPTKQPQARISGKDYFLGANVYTHEFTRQHGFVAEKTAKLHALLEQHGAKVYRTEEELEAGVDGAAEDGFVVVPAGIPEEKLLPIPDAAANMQVVTDWWVESCYGHKRLLDADHLLCRPFKMQTVQGFENFAINSTGFADYDLLHVNKAVKMMGGKYSEYLQAGVEIIVFNTFVPINKEKLEFAIGLKIPAVSEQWLISSIEQGVRQNVKPYLVKTETPTVPLDYEPPKTKTSAPKPSTKSRPGQLELDTSAPARTKTLPKKKPAQLPKSKARQGGPFFEDDEDTAPVPQNDGTSQHRQEHNTRTPSQPLGELSQGQQNSQRRASQPSQHSQTLGKDKRSASLPHNENFHSSSAAIRLFDAAQTVAADTSQPTALQGPGPATQQKEQLNNAIATLLARKQQNASFRRDSPETSTDFLGRRRRGPLGRAASSGSLNTISPDISQDERRLPAALPPDPSQKIVYEDEKAGEEHRALIRKLGGQVDESEEARGRRVESVGLVRDGGTIGAGGGGGRPRRAAVKRR